MTRLAKTLTEASGCRPVDAVTGRAGWMTMLSLVLVFATSVPGLAQQKQLSVEELEQYISEQKAAFDAVRENRDATEKKAQAVRDALAEQSARREKVEAELNALCEEQEKLQSGSYEQCLAALDS